MARTSRRQPNSYRGGRVVGNLAYDERYAERRAPRRESEQRLFDAMGVSSAWIGRRLVEIVDRCMQATPHLTRNPETKQREPDGIWEFDPAGAMRALHELDEHLRALREEKMEDGALSLEEWLARQEGASAL